MWFLPSRGRPQGIRDFISSWYKTKASTKVLLILDADDEKLSEYKQIVYPYNWNVQINPTRKSLIQILNDGFKENPWLEWYGCLSDDMFPLTDFWDVELIKSCLPNKIAYPDDTIRGETLCTLPCLGGQLVRDLGFIILPQLTRLYGDNVMMDIGRKRNCLAYRSDIVVEHRHFSTGKTPYDATAQKPSAHQDRLIYEAWREQYNPLGPIHVVCVNARNYCGRGVEYTNILYDMVKRNLPDGFKGDFTVFTDELDANYSCGIEQRLIEEDLVGWWNKLYLFKKDLFPVGERVIFFDLDTIIVRELDEIIRYQGEFATLRDFYHPATRLGPAVIMWKSGGRASKIWEAFVDGAKDQTLARGDQEFIENMQLNPDILQDLYPNSFYSYKTSCQNDIPRTAKVICFHGIPRPHEVSGNWVPHLWKEGANLITEWINVGNTSDEIVEANIKHSLDLPCEILAEQYGDKKDQKLLIIGGGPSLEKDLMVIKVMQEQGATIWALNNSFRYLCEKGIQPDGHIMLDSRAENANFIPDQTDAFLIYSAQCSPEVFEKAIKSGGKIIIWCASVEKILTILTEKKKRAAIIAGGSSVGLKAIGLAHLFGFSDIHLFGYDSSYTDGNNHAYGQSLNDNERITDIHVWGKGDSKTFKCAPWMAQQGDEFMHTIPEFIKKGMVFSVHGEGLIPYLAQLME